TTLCTHRPFSYRPCCLRRPDLHSFPTRRSSDLGNEALFDVGMRVQPGVGAADLGHPQKMDRPLRPRVYQAGRRGQAAAAEADDRSEEHTSELQSHLNLVCRLLLEKKKQM